MAWCRFWQAYWKWFVAIVVVEKWSQCPVLRYDIHCVQNSAKGCLIVQPGVWDGYPRNRPLTHGCYCLSFNLHHISRLARLEWTYSSYLLWKDTVYGLCCFFPQNVAAPSCIPGWGTQECTCNSQFLKRVLASPHVHMWPPGNFGRSVLDTLIHDLERKPHGPHKAL